MPEKNIDLHGSAPDKHEFALLLVDVINDFDFPEANQLLKYARPMARNLLRLKRRAQKAGVPVVYVNDNFRAMEIRVPAYRPTLCAAWPRS
jgi:nicotinamidase-related amidase